MRVRVQCLWQAAAALLLAVCCLPVRPTIDRTVRLHAEAACMLRLPGHVALAPHLGVFDGGPLQSDAAMRLRGGYSDDEDSASLENEGPARSEEEEEEDDGMDDALLDLAGTQDEGGEGAGDGVSTEEKGDDDEEGLEKLLNKMMEEKDNDPEDISDEWYVLTPRPLSQALYSGTLPLPAKCALDCPRHGVTKHAARAWVRDRQDKA